MPLLGIWCQSATAQEAGLDKFGITTQEKQAVRAILNSGPGERLKIKDFLPKTEPGLRPFSFGGPEPASWLVVFRESGEEKYQVLSNMEVLDPMDAQSGRQKSGPELFRDLSEGAVVRFIGRVLIQPCTFASAPDDPLTFTWSVRHGLVYLHGKGSVAWPLAPLWICDGVACLQKVKP